MSIRLIANAVAIVTAAITRFLFSIVTALQLRKRVNFGADLGLYFPLTKNPPRPQMRKEKEIPSL